MSKHTPGPWKVVRDGNPLSAGIVAVIEHSPDRHIAVEEDHFGGPWCAPDTWEANARLIAAAPELLEALREACRLYAEYGLVAGHVEGDPLAVGRWIGAARAAIAKAEGR
jgi:hypothetical protein